MRMLLYFVVISVLKVIVVRPQAVEPVTILKCGNENGRIPLAEDYWTVPGSLLDSSESSENVKFKLEEGSPGCKNLLEIQVNLLPPSSQEGFPNGYGNVTFDREKEDTTTEGTKLAVHNNLVSAKFTYFGFLSVGADYYGPTEYCLDRILDSSIVFKVCDIKCGTTSSPPCIPICCSLGKVFYQKKTGLVGCAPLPYTSLGKRYYSPTFYEDEHTVSNRQITPHFYRYIPCKHNYNLYDQGSSAHFRVLNSGAVKFFHSTERSWQELNHGSFCLSGLVKSQSEEESPLIYAGMESDQVILMCEDYKTNEVVAFPQFYVPAYLMNSIVLFITGVVYFVLRDKQNVHGWSVLSFVTSMFFMFTFLTMSHLLAMSSSVKAINDEDENDESLAKNNTGSLIIENILCPFVGISAHFFFLATFCWLSVINFDLWWTFKSMAPLIMNGIKSKGQRRFIMYMIFAWGIPAFVVSTCLGLAYAYPDPLSEVKVPNYGRVNCFLEPSVKGRFLYYIVGILLGGNLIFMCMTFYIIYKFRQGTRAVRSNSNNNLSAKLFFKLFVVMGVTWIFEFISWFLGFEETSVIYWIILDIFNILQSVGVFFIFVCKRKILNQLEQAYPKFGVMTAPLKKLRRKATLNRSVTITSSRDPTLATNITTGTLSLCRIQNCSKKERVATPAEEQEEAKC